jgi:hypothetical protein
MTTRLLIPILMPLVLLPTACSEEGTPFPSSGGTGGTSAGAGGGPGTGGSAQAGSGASGGSVSGAGGSGPRGGAAGAATGGSGGMVAGTGGASGNSGTAAQAGSESKGGAGGSAGMPSGGSAGSGDAGSSPGGSAGSGGGSAITCPTETETTFSFFLASQRALAMDSGNADGYGGDLGGITGADAICKRIAESVSPCQAGKVWRAFLSTSTENAIDRIGDGPWYDRLGRLFGNTKSDILADRPPGDEFFATDVATEDGSPSRDPNGTGPQDNHQTLTGSGLDGKVYTQDAEAGGQGRDDSCGGEDEWTVQKATCWDWTSSEPLGCPRVGHSWPRAGSGVNWISVWNEGGCAPGGTVVEMGGLDGTRRVGSAGGYGGFYCFAILPD